MAEPAAQSASSSGDASSSTPAVTKSKSTQDSTPLALDADVVDAALAAGVDLRDYSASVELQLQTVQRDAVRDYIREAEKIAGLHKEIAQCDSVLERIEGILSSFQSDLGSISHDIESLQGQSVALQRRLKNRKAVRADLTQYVDRLIIPKEMINAIENKEPSDRAFLEQLHELQHKLNFLKEQELRDARACDDVANVATNLTFVAVDKIRTFLLGRLYQLRKPLANFQVPQNSLLNYRFYYEFLLSRERSAAEEVQVEFVSTLQKMYYSYFKTYVGRLMKLQHTDTATSGDLLGAEDRPSAGATASSMLFGTRPTVRNRATVFSLGNRLSVLTDDLEAALIVPHVAATESKQFHYEALFRSVHYALVEHACHEYLVITGFFMLDGQRAVDLFVQVMNKAIQIVMKNTEEYASSSWDAIGLLLCVRLAHAYAQLMRRRGTPALDAYWAQVEQQLWPRLETVLRAHVDSVRAADPHRLGTIDSRPHYIVRRFAELAVALLSVEQCVHPQGRVSGDGDGQKDAGERSLQRSVVPLVNRLQSEIDHFLGRLSKEVPGGRKQQYVCLINNYDLILSVFTERLEDGGRETAFVRELLQTQVQLYVDELLFPHFGALMNFVKECEPLAASNHVELLTRYNQKVPNIVRSFTDNWKRAIGQINEDVMRSFTNFKNGTNVLQTALSELAQYYHRFQQLLQHAAFAQCAARHELVNIHHVMVELKKYKQTF